MSSILCAKCGYTAITDDIKFPISPVPDLLRGHYVASPSEAQVIHETISTTRVHIAQLAGEMVRLQGFLDELARKRDALESYTEIHISLLTPVRSLPVEILSEIFLRIRDATTPDTTHGEWNIRSPKLNKTPLLLGSVCSRWRTVTLSTPSLWASFSLTVGSDHVERSTALAEMWLARAGVGPLSISLCAHIYIHSMRPFMQTFLPYCERWYEIKLDLPTAFMDNWYPAKNRLLSLHKLFIGTRCGPNDVFALAPRLRHLYLDSYYPPSEFQLPWSQLQFCGGTRGCDSCLELLRLTPNLEECVIWPYNSGEVSHTPAQLSRVHRMRIHRDPTHFLNKLLLPELRELFLVDDDNCGGMNTPPKLAQYPLELLSVDGYLIYDIGMIQILRNCSSLVHLELRKCSVGAMTKNFLTQFAYHRSYKESQMPPLAPRLRTIKVDCDPQEFNMIIFADAIQSRMTLDGIILGSENTSVAKLETVDIHALSHLEPWIQPRLYQLRDMGLEINLLDRYGNDYLNHSKGSITMF